MSDNVDQRCVQDFGREWEAFTQRSLDENERKRSFDSYFGLLDWKRPYSRALDLGCGSGRWDDLIAERVGSLVAADASEQALNVARANVKSENVIFVKCTPDAIPYSDEHFDLILSIGVLHHVPDTAAAIRSLAAKLDHGGTMLLYLYYAFDNRPRWYRIIWYGSDLLRRFISRLPFFLKYVISQVIAATVYWPLARSAKLLSATNWPLSFYATRSFYAMRTDALDRFGTRLEQRFTREQITAMMSCAGLVNIRFSDSEPFWVCIAQKPGK